MKNIKTESNMEYYQTQGEQITLGDQPTKTQVIEQPHHCSIAQPCLVKGHGQTVTTPLH